MNVAAAVTEDGADSAGQAPPAAYTEWLVGMESKPRVVLNEAL